MCGVRWWTWGRSQGGVFATEKGVSMGTSSLARRESLDSREEAAGSREGEAERG